MNTDMNSLPVLPRVRRSWPRRLVRRLLLLCAAIVIAWSAGLAWFAEDMPAEPALRAETTDAIVVLTGGSARLRAGLDLLAQGHGRKLFVSGVYRGVEVAELLRVARARPDAVDCCIVLGHTAADTRGNALETRDWMEREGFASLTVVTSTYHMRRALLEFRRAMPQARLVPYAVLPDSWQRAAWWQRPESLMLVVHEFNKYLLALARPLLPEGEAGQAVS
jgi:uncharacterized SAM-binding protein YcdF (DUF218 family)